MANLYLRRIIESSIQNFLSWLSDYGYYSYDVNDLWTNKFGLKIKKKFYKNKLIALPAAMLIHIIDTFLPQTRHLFCKKKRIALGDAHLILGFLNYYKYTLNTKYLQESELLLDILTNYQTKSRNGVGWGQPYDWFTQYGMFPANIPLVTTTPYCFDAIFEYNNIRENNNHLILLEKIANFIAFDLKESLLPDHSVAASYGPLDDSKIVNANSYRASTLLKAFSIFKKNIYKDKALKNIEFILNSQNADGSWFYAADSKFIDNFHTCFILKNMITAYEIINDPNILQSIKRGYDFYSNNFIRKDGSLKPYFKEKYIKCRRIELYDYAEGIYLGCKAKKILVNAFEVSLHLAEQLAKNYQDKSGFFFTRVSSFYIKNRVPYISWPQAQLFRALTELLLEIKNNDDN